MCDCLRHHGLPGRNCRHFGSLGSEIREHSGFHLPTGSANTARLHREEETVLAEGTLIKAHTQCQCLSSLRLRINLGATVGDQHCGRWVSGERAGVSCSLVKLLVSASLVDQQLAWGELFPVGSLVPLEPVHYLLSTIQIHEAEGPCGGSRTLLKETAIRALR